MEREIDEASIPTLKCGLYGDRVGSGLWLRVQKSKRITWRFRGHVGGKQVKVFIGYWPAISLNEARLTAAELQQECLERKQDASKGAWKNGKHNSSKLASHAGFIYLVTCPVEGLVKIGKTVDIHRRMAEHRLPLIGYWTTEERHLAEKAIFRTLSEFRLARSCEFFVLDKDAAAEAIEQIIGSTMVSVLPPRERRKRRCNTRWKSRLQKAKRT